MEEKEEQHTIDGIRVVETQHMHPLYVNPAGVLAIILGTLTLVVASAFGLEMYNVYKGGVPMSEQTIATTSTPTEPPPPPPKPVQKRFPDYNFTASIPFEWKEASEYMGAPRTVQTVLHSYQLHPTICRATYAEVGTALHATESIRTQEGLNILRNGTLVTRAEYYTILESTTTSLVHELVQAYYPLYFDNGSDDITRNVWMLYTDDSSPIPDECEQSFLLFLSSLYLDFQNYSLSKNDEGTLFIEQHEELGSVLLFRPTSTQSTYRIASLSSGDIFKPTLVADTLYYVNTEGFLYAYPLFTGLPPTLVPFTITEGESVNDYIVEDSVIHALTGMWCHDDETTCNLTHRTYDLPTQTETTLEEGVTLPLLPDSETPTTSTAISFAQGTFGAEQDTLGGFTSGRKLILLSL